MHYEEDEEGIIGFMKQFLILLAIGMSSLVVAVAAPSTLDGNTQVPLDAVLSVGCIVVGGAWYLGFKINRFEMELKQMQITIKKLRCVREDKCEIPEMD
jgi:hypothetical protein